MANRIKIKLGDAEFEAEGSEESVQAQYELFLKALETKPREAAKMQPQSGGGKPHEKSPGAFDETLLQKIFELRADGIVALKVLPKGNDKEADALLLLLYGFRRMKQEEHVLATHLLRAAQHSGVQVYRPAQALAAYEQPYLIRGGQRKGSTYALNNQGIGKAEEVATKIFE